MAFALFFGHLGLSVTLKGTRISCLELVVLRSASELGCAHLTSLHLTAGWINHITDVSPADVSPPPLPPIRALPHV